MQVIQIGNLVCYVVMEWIAADFPNGQNMTTQQKNQNVEIDLWAEVAAALNRELVNMGYKDQKGVPDTEIVLRYFNAVLRQIPATPRTVHISKALVVPPTLQAGYDLLLKNVRTGQDLTPNMTARIRKETRFDGLLNCWGIHHFHLGESTYADDPNLIERTGPVLFARVTNTDFYAIHIEEHAEDVNPEAFYDQEMIEIMHANWPDMMAQFKSRSVVGIEQSHSNSDHKELRDGRVNVSFLKTKDGTIYHQPGLGVTSAKNGCSVEVALRQTQLKGLVIRLERTIQEEALKPNNAFDQLGCSKPYKFKLHFMGPEGIEAKEVSKSIYVSHSSVIVKNGNANEVKNWLNIRKSDLPY